MSHSVERPRDIQAARHIGLGELEAGAAGQMLDVLTPASRQIVDADDNVAPGQSERRTDASRENPLPR